MSLVSSLKGSPLFHDLLEAEIEMFLKGQELYTWNRGDFAIQGGKPIEAFYLIIEGQGDLIYNSWGREFLMQELKRGDHFGEVLFSNDQKHPYSVCASSVLTCLRIDFPVFKNIFEKNPQVYALFINNLLRIELNLKKQALGLVGRVNDESKFDIGLPIYNRRKSVANCKNSEHDEDDLEKVS
ncbi:MAG: cyclic nucleotide-binding domain-containing protein [Halobacteriovoraceae bacterium]|nr:cyclic nucleotide-binding domain-containing protein [Halobacteriovoraceae bacterium]